MAALHVLCCRLLLVVALAAASGVLHPSWHQYYPRRNVQYVPCPPEAVQTAGHKSAELSFMSRWAVFEEQLHGRAPRVRVGRGRYRLLPHGAELLCDFPPYLRLVSNVVWERADLGDSRSLNSIYKSFGLPHEFSVHMRTTGSTLHLLRTAPLDRGLYRCIVTAVDTASPRRPTLTAFQDIEFFPADRPLPPSRTLNFSQKSEMPRKY